MKRSIAVVLVVSMALQSSGCTTTSLVVPMRTVAQDVPTTVRGGATAVAANQNPNQAVAAPTSIRTLEVSTGEFLGGRAAGTLAGLALIGVIALVFFTGGNKGRGGGGGGGGPIIPTDPTVPTIPTGPRGPTD